MSVASTHVVYVSWKGWKNSQEFIGNTGITWLNHKVLIQQYKLLYHLFSLSKLGGGERIQMTQFRQLTQVILLNI